ncbi:MAG: DNA polymerase III subunit delta [Butyricicoccus sp.]
MAKPRKKAPNGADMLKRDLQCHEIGQLYLIGGEESYLKEHYLKRLLDEVLDDTFRDFNLEEFEGNSVSLEQLTNAIDSYPAMAERRVVVLKDLDVFKAPAALKEELPNILSDLPEYICLIIYYDTIELKPDKRTKLYTLINKIGCIADFSQLERHDLIPWVRRRVSAQKRHISDDTCDYLLFLCGTSMTNLVTEIDKACAHSATDEVTRKDIDAVCSKVLDAVIFDLTDAITAARFERALTLVGDLVAQKNEPIVLLGAVARHIQRMYAAKLIAASHGTEQDLMQVLDTKSAYYARKMRDSVRTVPLGWLRHALLLCGEADISMKTTGTDRQKVLELLLLRLAAAQERHT